MVILGTNCIDHDACFALVRDGEPLLVYEQERFNRVKNGHSYGVDALWAALDDAGIGIGDVEHVTNVIDHRLVPGREQLLLDAFGDGEQARAEAAERTRYAYAKAVQYEARLRALGFADDAIIPVRHHLGHCAAVYYPSPYDETAILTIDGSGEHETAVVAHGRGRTIEVLRSVPYPHSIGHLYYAVTRWLGWGYGEEGKTMALASYGRPRFIDEFEEHLLAVGEDGFFRARQLLNARTGVAILTDLLGDGRQPGEAVRPLHEDVAATVQALTERVVVRLARTARSLTGSRRLVLSGGVALNSVANGLLLKEGVVDELGIYPQANDAGIALGGALYAHYALLGNERRDHWQFTHAYWGRHVDVERVPEHARRLGLRYRTPGDLTATVAGHLAEGRLVGWVQGRAEIGPRALGNRSILANPFVPGVRDAINARVKFREPWRPFAPSILAEDLHEVFVTPQPLPWMLCVADARPEYRERIASVLHVDGTARVQSVTAAQNPLFHDLLCRFKEHAGVGMLLNTSFNVKGEPLVQDSLQAMHDYLRTDLDVLVIGPYVFERKPEGVRVAPFSAFLHNLRRFDAASSLLLVVPEGGGATLGRLLPALGDGGAVTVVIDEGEEAGLPERVRASLGGLAGTMRAAVPLLCDGLDAALADAAVAHEATCVLLPEDPVRYGHFAGSGFDSTPLRWGTLLTKAGSAAVWFASPSGNLTSYEDVAWLETLHQ